MGAKTLKTQNRKIRNKQKRTRKNTRNHQINGGGFKDIMNKILRKQSYNLPLAQPQNLNTAPQPKDHIDEIYKDHIDEIYKEKYLECVNLNTQPGISILELKRKIMFASFGSVNQFRNMLNRISLDLPTFQSIADKPKSEWVDCTDECSNTLSSAISKELNSTAYMLRVLSMSLVNDKSAVPPNKTQNPCYNSFGGKIEFKIAAGVNYFTGIWETDKQKIHMDIYPQQQSTNTSATHATGRLIMGFGPSASGKTHCAAKVIQLMQKVEPGFPGVFLAIDGGLYREQSVVYQTITSHIKEKDQYTGLTNLVASGVFGGSLFKSEIIKQAVVEYLKNLNPGKNSKKHINLYVPETLGSCQSLTDKLGFKQCIDKYDVYIKLTGDTNWVGLMIYQHITPDECIYKDDYKCVGTKQSGETRAQNEGKEYSPDAWYFSYKNGNVAVSAAPRYRFRIHNSGTPDKWSIFEDQSVPSLIDDTNKTLIDTSIDNNQSRTGDERETILKFLEEIQWKYISGKVKDSLQCAEYVEPVKVNNKCERLTNLTRLKARLPTIKRSNNPSHQIALTNLVQINSGENVNSNNSGVSNE